MNTIEDARHQPIFKTDQRADGQKGFYPGGAGNRRQYTALQLNHKNAKLHPNGDRRYQKKVLNDFAMNLNIGAADLLKIVFQSIHDDFAKV